MTIDKRCFLQWFVLTLGYSVAAFFAWHYGLLTDIWNTDATHMTSVIGAMFVAAIGYMGFASWRYDRHDKLTVWGTPRQSNVAYADVGIGHFAGAAVIYVGLIGTVLGLMAQLKGLAAVDPANPASGITFLGLTGKALGTAFYATGAGLVAALAIGVVTQNLTYFLQRNEVAE